MKLVEMDKNVTFFQQIQTEDTGPVVLINHFHVDPADEEEFLNMWQVDAAYMLRAGCLSGQMHKGTEGSASFINIAVWENAQTLGRAFMKPEFQELIARYPASATASPHLFRKLAIPGVCVA
ncbi:antibiotic biosynthesis monooxygenase [Agrobacterium rhizogenes]|nr:antibiotic biosynthesis monooxygenase [Rhizobium rhizogenes]